MIKSFFKLAAIAVVATSLTGCLTRIETGAVGVRINMSKEIQPGELLPGSWNQTVFGSVLEFPVKDITLSLENKTPMTSENTPLSDFDLSVVYQIAPEAVAELYSTKSKSFHAKEQDGDVLLMYRYIETLVNNAAYKVVRGYNNLNAADSREKIEQEIRNLVQEQLKSENLDQAINLTVVQVRNILPNAQIQQSATELVKSQNALKIKENEVKLAELESLRMKALSSNSQQSIEYMKAQAELILAEAVKEGKVQTYIIPHNMTMFTPK